MPKNKKNNPEISQNFLKSSSSSLLKNIIFYCFLFIFVILVIKAFLIDNFLARHVFQEWLVNYSQGFVRRGLAGTFFLFLQEQHHVNIYKLIKYFAYFTFLLFSFIYILKVRQSQKILGWEALMVVLFLPSLILFPLHDRNVIGRKEFFFFFGLLINLFLIQKTQRNFKSNIDIKTSLISHQTSVDAVNKYCYSLFIWYNLLSLPTTLSHEAIIFLALPLNMVITANLISLQFSKKQVVWRTIIIYLPTIFVSFLCLVFKGNNGMALGICQSWQEYSHLYSNLPKDCNDYLPGILRFFGISTKDVIRKVWSANIISLQGFPFFMWIFAFFLNTVILMRISSSILINSLEKIKHKNSELDDSNFPSSVDIITSFSFKYAFIPFSFSFILYIVALDWGRWFFITSITYALCLLSPSLIRIEIASYHQNKGTFKILSSIYSIYSKVIIYLHNQYFLQRFSIIYFLGLIYTLFILRIPHFSIDVKDLYMYGVMSRMFNLVNQYF